MAAAAKNATAPLPGSRAAPQTIPIAIAVAAHAVRTEIDFESVQEPMHAVSANPARSTSTSATAPIPQKITHHTAPLYDRALMDEVATMGTREGEEDR